MAYNPNMYMPQPLTPVQPSWFYQQPQVTAQPVNGLVSVTGLEGAKAYQLPPNSSMPLFDKDSDVLYVKTTDSGGYPTIRAFEFHPVEQQAAPAPADYVPREEFEALVAKVEGLTATKATAARTTRKAATDGE